MSRIRVTRTRVIERCIVIRETDKAYLLRWCVGTLPGSVGQWAQHWVPKSQIITFDVLNEEPNRYFGSHRLVVTDWWARQAGVTGGYTPEDHKPWGE